MVDELSLLWPLTHRPSSTLVHVEALHPTVSVPPLSCFASFPSAWSVLSASHQTVASPFLKQTRCVLHLMVHSGCCLYPVDSKVPWKGCSPSIVISLLPSSFFESLSVPLYPHHWPSTALALVSRDLHVVSGQFSIPLLLDPPIVSSILPETLLSPRLPAASLLSGPYWPRCLLPSLGAPLSSFCLVSFLIPAWRSQATKDPSVLTSALSPLGGIGSFFWKGPNNKSFKFFVGRILSYSTLMWHKDSPR